MELDPLRAVLFAGFHPRFSLVLPAQFPKGFGGLCFPFPDKSHEAPPAGTHSLRSWQGMSVCPGKLLVRGRSCQTHSWGLAVSSNGILGEKPWEVAAHTPYVKGVSEYLEEFPEVGKAIPSAETHSALDQSCDIHGNAEPPIAHTS